jgi:hypothetical protein
MKIVLYNFLKNSTLIFFSILITFFFAEILLRVTGSTPFKKNSLLTIEEPVTNIPNTNLGWLPKKGVHKFNPWATEGKETTLTINEDRSRYIKNNKDVLNQIIFIGGSLTQGWAVDDKETFSFLLQKKYKNYNILNFGVGGYGGYQSLLTLEHIFKKTENIKHVVYGFIPHHEVRNVAAGSWLYLLNGVSKRGVVELPYVSINKKGQLHRNQSIKYIKLPLSEYSALIAKIEKKIMKLKSYLREKNQTRISLLIIESMKELAIKNNSKFSLLILDKFRDQRTKQYEKFLMQKKITNFKCFIPSGKKYVVPGEGHPNEISHKIISECIFKKLNL